MRCFVARPKGVAGRAVVVLQEAFGVNDHICDLASRFAQLGFLAIAPDLFHRSGEGVLGYDQHSQAVALISQIGIDAIEQDVSAVLEHLGTAENVDSSRTAVVGFCFGGRAAFSAATRLSDLGAVVVFYGPGIAAGPHAVLEHADRIRSPMLLHVGEEDPTIPQAHVEAIDSALRQAGVEFAQYVYPDAGHAFLCDARPNMYREHAAKLAWNRTAEFLEATLPNR
jgi:carboxymethylenebutenolidase